MKNIFLIMVLIIFNILNLQSNAQSVGKVIDEVIKDKGKPVDIIQDDKKRIFLYLYEEKYINITYTIKNDTIKIETWIVSKPYMHSLVTYTLHSFGYYQLCPFENGGVYYRNYNTNIEVYIEERSWGEEIIVHFYEK